MLPHVKWWWRWLFVLSVTLMPIATVAQSPIGHPSMWYVDAALGYHGAMPHFGVTGAAQVAFQDSASCYAIQIFSASEIIGFGGYHGPDLAQESVTGLALLYGRSHRFTLSRPLFPLFPLPLLVGRETLYQITVAAGVSAQRSVLRDGPVEWMTIEGVVHEVRAGRSHTVFGLPLRIELTQQLTPSIGYVHRIEGNLNGARHFWAVMWAVQVGW